MNELSATIEDTIRYAREGLDAFFDGDTKGMSDALFTILGAMLHAQVQMDKEVAA